MGRSSGFNRKPIIDYISKIPNLSGNLSILDLGAGFGNFGKLIKGKVKVPTRVVGVEIWEKYRNKKWSFYDEMLVGDMRDYLKKNKKKFDVVLLVDVLEHFDRKEGLALIKKALSLKKRALIVSTPLTAYPQGSHGGNEHQEHKHIWTEQELIKMGFKKLSCTWRPTYALWPPFAKLGVYVLE